jgi:hypothetical protein
MVETKKRIYVSHDEMLAEYHNSQKAGQPTEKLVVLFTKIAKHFSTQFRYVNKCDENACINYAVSEAWRKWDKFDVRITDNVFSFYTTMLANDLRIHYKKITKGKNVNISIESLFSNDNK